MFVRHLLKSLTRYNSCSYSTRTKVPILYKTTEIDDPNENQNEAATLQVLSWGRGFSGQLGGGDEESRLYPAPVASLVVCKPFTAPVSGRIIDDCSDGKKLNGYSNFLWVVSFWVGCRGEVVDLGEGDGGRLGLGHENSAFVPTLNPYLDDPVRCIALGGVHSVALTSLGLLFTWGYGGFGALGHSVYHRELFPRLAEGAWNGKIKHVVTSGMHTAAITETGELYSWGLYEGDGRLALGHGRGPNEGGGLSTPSKVKALPGPVAAVCCGGFFAMALTEEGQLWNWGGSVVGNPNQLLVLKNVIQLASGGYHSLALTGKVLSWGNGGHGQLGHSSTQNQKVPTLIGALADDIDIACGGSSSAAVTDKGKLYMWGNAKDSQLAVPGLPEVQPGPVESTF